MDIRQFGLPDVQVSQFNLDSFSGETFGYFNLITALELLEHLHNPGKLFQLISTHLVPGGRVIITTPNIHSIAARLLFLIRGRLPHFDNRSDATHVYPVYLENLERVLPHYKLKIEQVAFFPSKGHQLYNQFTIALSQVLSLLLPEKYRGDNLLLVLTLT
jgi:2-polyprenyl-3-methyl-5-hydroxy-6-metoxy-1,4-benzoquinol methylase